MTKSKQFSVYLTPAAQSVLPDLERLWAVEGMNRGIAISGWIIRESVRRDADIQTVLSVSKGNLKKGG